MPRKLTQGQRDRLTHLAEVSVVFNQNRASQGAYRSLVARGLAQFNAPVLPREGHDRDQDVAITPRGRRVARSIAP